MTHLGFLGSDTGGNMSPTIFLVAIAHAVPIFLTCVVSKRKSSLQIVAGVMVVIAIFTGGASYALFDLIAIGIAYFVCLSNLGPKID